jgi:hypothetical protein
MNALATSTLTALVAAGPPADSGSFALYRCSGQAADAATPVADADPRELRPKALIATLGSGRLQLLNQLPNVSHHTVT